MCLRADSRAIERGPDGGKKFFRTIRLADESDWPSRASLVRLDGIAAGEQHADLWIAAAQLAQRIAAGQAWHGYIEDDQVNGPRFAAVNVHGLLTVLGEKDAVAIAL